MIKDLTDHQKRRDLTWQNNEKQAPKHDPAFITFVKIPWTAVSAWLGSINIAILGNKGVAEVH